jgi:hypothetical protein
MTCKCSARVLIYSLLLLVTVNTIRYNRCIFRYMYVCSLNAESASVAPPLIYFFNLEIVVVNVHVIILILDDLRFVIGLDD